MAIKDTASFKTKDKIYDSLNMIKIFFILLVIARHFHWFFDLPRIKIVYIAILSMVDIFMGYIFLVSGLGLTLSMLRKPINNIEFYKKRLIRVYPLYIISLVLYLFFVANIDGYNFFAHLVNIHNFIPIYSHNPKPLWFVGIILQFYLVYPLLFIMLSKHGTRLIIGSSLIYIVYALMILLYEYQSGKALYISSNLQDVTLLFYIIQFTVGMYMGRLIYQGERAKLDRLIGKGLVIFICLIPLTGLQLLFGSEKLLYYLFKFISPIYCFGTIAVIYTIIDKYIHRKTVMYFSVLSGGVYSVYLFHEFILAGFSLISKSPLFGIFVGVPMTLLIGYLIQIIYDKALSKISTAG